jgi:ribonucleoside-diphosphate reductase alpha chain
MDDDDTWSSITVHEGSVQHLDFMSDDEKDTFKTAFEIDQRWLIDHAGDRAEFICQSQSLNVFLPADVEKKTLHDVHWRAWQKGVKSLYYCRSRSVVRAESHASLSVTGATAAPTTGGLGLPVDGAIQPLPLAASDENDGDYEECLSCQ